MDPGVLTLKAFAVLGLAVLNGFFVAAEFALVKVRLTQLDPLILKGHRRARIARGLLNHLDATIGATQLGITLVSLGLGVLVEPVFEGLLGPIFNFAGVSSVLVRHRLSIGVGFVVSTFLLVVIGELGPKALAIRRTLPTALWTAQPLAWFCRISFPFIWILNHSAQWLLRQIGIQPVNEGDLGHSEEELRLLFAATSKRTRGTSLGHEIVLNALDLRNLTARDVMRPRQEIVVFNTGSSMTECLDIAEKTRFSRFPLCETGDVDKSLGVVHFKDLYAMRLKARSGAELLAVARKIVYVPETARLESVLHRFLDRRLHLAIVVDEYGGTVGLLTLENIIEELVGQIQDEFDQEKPLMAKVGERTWEVQGALPVRDLAELIGEPLDDDAVTTSGWVTRRLGGFAKVGDVIPLATGELRVEEMDETRVSRLRLKKKPPGEIPEA
ncbi:MAG: magnesium and cobalt exporter, family [Verrucomicrobiota bacterium]|jgi:CBS domain containing-hemolysin-like protein